MKTLLGLAVALVVGLSAAAAQDIQPTPILQGVGVAKNPFADAPTTHKQVADFKVRSTDNKHALQTIGIDSEGRVLGLTSAPKTFGVPMKNVTSEVHVFTPDGKSVSVLKADFHGNSVTGGPDGAVYLAGDGKIAKFDRAGKQVAVIDLPHIAELLSDTGGLRKKAEEQIKQQQESFGRTIKLYQERIKALEDKTEADRTDLEKRQLNQYKLSLKSIEQFTANQSVDAIVAQMTGRLRTINAVTISTKDVFIACGDTQGYGYAIWRMDHDFKNPKKVLTGIGGCCGQMDIQTTGADLLVAENTKHRFARYDRDGKSIGSWGKRGTGNEVDCFGGCCNPMNVCATSTGDIFTAESEGVIKRFSPKGDFLGIVATASLSGGCKNVAVAVTRDEQHVYFLDLPGSRIIVLGKTK